VSIAVTSPSARANRGPVFWGLPLWAVAILGMVFLLACLPVLVPSVNPIRLHPDNALAPVGQWPFLLGTDDLGRDLLARLAVGAQVSLVVSLATAAIGMGVGGLYGMLAAWWGGRAEQVLLRGIDVIYSLPGLMVVILLAVYLGRTVESLVLALAFLSWPDTARLVHGEMVRLRESACVEAYASMGGGSARLLRTFFLPSVWPTLLVSAMLTVPRSLLTESSLSFIGLGVQPPLTSWGRLASDGWQLVRLAPQLLLIPALAIVLTMMALLAVGDRLKASLPQQGSD